MSKLVKAGDRVFYMKRPTETMANLPDDQGEWLAGAGRILKVFDKTGTESLSCMTKNVGKVRILTELDESGDRCVVECSVGEFTDKMENFLANLLA